MGSPPNEPVMRSFDIFIVVSMNKLINEQSISFSMRSDVIAEMSGDEKPPWRPCDVNVIPLPLTQLKITR